MPGRLFYLSLTKGCLASFVENKFLVATGTTWDFSHPVSIRCAMIATSLSRLDFRYFFCYSGPGFAPHLDRVLKRSPLSGR